MTDVAHRKPPIVAIVIAVLAVGFIVLGVRKLVLLDGEPATALTEQSQLKASITAGTATLVLVVIALILARSGRLARAQPLRVPLPLPPTGGAIAAILIVAFVLAIGGLIGLAMASAHGVLSNAALGLVIPVAALLYVGALVGIAKATTRTVGELVVDRSEARFVIDGAEQRVEQRIDLTAPFQLAVAWRPPAPMKLACVQVGVRQGGKDVMFWYQLPHNQRPSAALRRCPLAKNITGTFVGMAQVGGEVVRRLVAAQQAMPKTPA